MMEFIDESVVLTSIHSAKGLEWEYVIIPKLNSFHFLVHLYVNHVKELIVATGDLIIVNFCTKKQWKKHLKKR